MRNLSFTVLFVLLGCAYHPLPASVFGKSGIQYQAPTLCGALTKCLNTESACYFEANTYTTQSGAIEQTGCKEVTK